jgi:hypothetical protein
MYDQTVVNQIEELLSTQLTFREIAAKMGVSRGTVARVNRGRPRMYGQTLPEPAPPQRCPECRNLVSPPCRICLARRHLHHALALKRSGLGCPPEDGGSHRPAA